MRSRALFVALAIAGSALPAACGDSADGRHGTAARATAGTAEWRAPNADLANTRRLDSQIDGGNVAGLREAWSVPLRGTYAATPIVAGGVVYTEDLMSNVYAIDLASGRVKWRRDYGVSDTGPNGVNVADGRVFAVTPSAAIALDADKDGVVFASTVPTSGGDVGTLWALDARTGRIRWRWEQVPRSLWGDAAVNGGGGLWHPPAFDGDGGLYISIANPVPWPGTEAQPWDLECPVILATADGRRVALSAGKMGFVYAFDAETGKVLWKRSVGIHNGHDDDSVRAMHGDYSRVGYRRRIYPGDWGGVETQMASDGTTVYVPVNNLYAIYGGQTLTLLAAGGIALARDHRMRIVAFRLER